MSNKPEPTSWQLMTEKELLFRMAQIETELSSLHYQNQHSTVDMDGNKRRNLGEEQVFLRRLYDAKVKARTQGD